MRYTLMGSRVTDLEAIMARGGPKAGEALSLNLPAQPPSSSDIKIGYESLQDRFEQTIDAKIEALTRSQSKNDPPEKARSIVAQIERYTDLKGRGVLGYAELGKEDPSFMQHAKKLEETRPGIVTLNPMLIEFGSAYTSYWGDIEDDAKLDSAPNGGGTPSSQGTPTGVITFETASEFESAVEAGQIKPNAKVKVANNPTQVFTPPPSYDYNVSDEFPLEEDNRARLMSETTDSFPIEGDNRSRLLSEANAPEPITAASSQGKEHRELIVDLGGAISEGWESGNTLLASSDAAGRGALFNGVANFVDYFGALAFNDMESSPLAGSLREAAEKQKQKAAEVAAEGWAKYIEDNTGQEVPYTETEKAKELFATRVAQYPMRLPGESPQGFMIRTGKQLPGGAVSTAKQSVAPLDVTNRKTTRDTFIPQVLAKIDIGDPGNAMGLKDMLYELRADERNAMAYDSSIIRIKTKEDLKKWAEPYFNARSMFIDLTPEQEKTFIDVTFDLLQQVQDMKKEGTLRRVQDLDRQFLADEKNYPQPITGFVTPAKTEEEKRLEAEMVKVDEALRRVQDLDRQFLADEKNYPQPISAMTSVDPLSINTRSDLKSAIAERTGAMPPDYKKQMVSAVTTINETLKAFEDSVNVKTKSAIDAVSISNINEAITNIVDRMFDTVVGNETLEDRIMKTEAGQNRAYAFTKLQDQFGALTLFPERIPGDIDLGPTMGEVASDYLHSTQDKINESIASAFKSLLSKIGIGKPESLVTRPR